MVYAIPKTRFGAMLPQPFDAAGREMSHLFDALWNSVQNGQTAERTWFAPAALWEEGDCFHVEADLPGVQRESLELTLEKNILRISAERQAPEAERTYWHNERAFGRVERSITLPETVDPDSIEASLKDGVLLVKLRKRPESLAKRIEIKS